MTHSSQIVHDSHVGSDALAKGVHIPNCCWWKKSWIQELKSIFPSSASNTMHASSGDASQFICHPLMQTTPLCRAGKRNCLQIIYLERFVISFGTVPTYWRHSSLMKHICAKHCGSETTVKHSFKLIYRNSHITLPSYHHTLFSLSRSSLPSWRYAPAGMLLDEPDNFPPRSTSVVKKMKIFLCFYEESRSIALSTAFIWQSANNSIAHTVELAHRILNDGSLMWPRDLYFRFLRRSSAFWDWCMTTIVVHEKGWRYAALRI